MNPNSTKLSFCYTCKTEREATLHVEHAEDNHRRFVWVCGTCKYHNPFREELYVSKGRIEGRFTPEEIEALPVIMSDTIRRCTKCGERGAQVHHWAPRAIFGDECEKWPKDYLCQACHDIWHQLVTPEISKKF